MLSVVVLYIIIYFCTKYKEPCRPFAPLIFGCVHGSPVAHDAKKFTRYFFDLITFP